MIFDPVLHILPGRVPKSAYMTMSATPAIILLVHVLTVTASYGTSLFAVMTWSLTYSLNEQLATVY